MGNSDKEPFQVIIYTENENNEPLIESYILPIQYTTKCSDKLTIELKLKINDELNQRIEYINKNMNKYSKIVFNIGGETKILKD